MCLSCISVHNIVFIFMREAWFKEMVGFLVTEAVLLELVGLK